MNAKAARKIILPKPPKNLPTAVPKNAPIFPESSCTSVSIFSSNLSIPKNDARITAITRRKLLMYDASLKFRVLIIERPQTNSMTGNTIEKYPRVA